MVQTVTAPNHAVPTTGVRRNSERMVQS